jgi:hypothetical protein
LAAQTKALNLKRDFWTFTLDSIEDESESGLDDEFQLGETETMTITMDEDG